VSQRGRLMSISRRSSSWAWTPAGLGIMAGLPSWAGIRRRSERAMKIVLPVGVAGAGRSSSRRGGQGVADLPLDEAEDQQGQADHGDQRGDAAAGLQEQGVTARGPLNSP
jgi:hypothetical protein